MFDQEPSPEFLQMLSTNTAFDHTFHVWRCYGVPF